MKERPILFSAPMVKALITGTKTQTRRIAGKDLVDAVKFMGDGSEPTDENLAVVQVIHDGHSGVGAYVSHAEYTEEGSTFVRAPYGVPGDRLWVRETWQYADWTEDGYPFVRYAADGARTLQDNIPAEWSDRVNDAWATLSDAANVAIDQRAADRKWRPSIFLPRWASRLTLEVTDVRVERVQDISEADAEAEGVTTGFAPDVVVGCKRELYAQLWDEINGSGSWKSNPFVWCVSFRVLPGGAQ